MAVKKYFPIINLLMVLSNTMSKEQT